MEIRLIFFKEIVGLISLKTELKYQYPMHLRAQEEKSTRRFFARGQFVRPAVAAPRRVAFSTLTMR